MDNLEEQVLVIPRNKLFDSAANRSEFQGISFDIEPYKAVFTHENLLFRPRSLVENEEQYKQIIPYLAFSNVDGEILSYQRTKLSGEVRLHGNWSMGFGGHMNDGDEDFIGAIHRERKEELSYDWRRVNPNINLRMHSVINDDSNGVGRVHFGVVFWTEILGEGRPTSTDISIDNVGWTTKAELGERSIENWTRLLLEALV